MALQAPDEVITLLIRHHVRPDQAERYEHWLRRIVRVAQSYPGHLGIDVIRSQEGGLQLFTSVLRFASTSQLQLWLSSDDRQQLIEEVSPLLASGDAQEVSQTREFWFTPAGDAPRPPRWKQACVTFLVILPLSLLVPWLWQPVFARLPWLGGHLASNALITLTIVLLVVYLCMPHVTRWLARWLNAP